MNIHRLDYLVRPTCEFSLSKGSLTLAQAAQNGFFDLGNVVAIEPKNKAEKIEHRGAYRGILRKDKTLVKEASIEYEVTLDELHKENFKYIFFGVDNGQFTQSALTAASMDTLQFSLVPGVKNHWYDVTNSGARVRDITTLTITGLVEGTDFVVDYKLGRVRFLANQTVDRVPVVTAPAITASSVSALNIIKPLEQTQIRGIGRITLWDDSISGKLLADIYDFSCELTFASIDPFNGDKITEVKFDLLVTDIVGAVGVANI